MLNFEPKEPARTPDKAGERRRRVLIVAEQDAGFLQQRFVDSGYDAQLSIADDASRAIKEFTPDALVIEIDQERPEDGEKYFGFARRLRAEAATYALPLVFVFHEDNKNLRSFALQTGADDYFAMTIPRAELRARMDALFWRVEAGRRVAFVVGDQRVEIDNFMVMLDAVRADIRAGLAGSLALVYAAPREGVELDRGGRDRTLAEGYGFLKLNLRRADAVAFYGPTTLIIYFPRLPLVAATQSLTRLREEFESLHTESSIIIGFASFPEDGMDVENLIASAEMDAGMTAADSRAAQGNVEKAEASEATQSAVEEQESDAREVEEESFIPETEDAEFEEEITEAVAAEETGAVVEESFEAEQFEEKAEIEAAPQQIEQPVVQKMETEAHAEEDAAARAAEAAAQERERRASGAIMPRRLLLTVSDAARMVQINSLIRAAGYEARAAFDGQQALDLLRIERPDLLLLDYELHGMNGVEMLRRLRKQGGGKLGLPVVLILPSENENERREALALGAHSVVSMPYDPFALLESVRVAGNID